MKHLIVTEDVNSLGFTEYDRVILDSITNEIVYRRGVTYEYVDLGLSVKWAKCNVGAEKETDYGYYFQWGETTSDTVYDWAHYKYCNGSQYTLTKYNTSTSYGENPDNKTTLESEDDAASQIMGGDWRMPTKAEFDELLSGTTKEWTQVNGVNGYKFTSNKEGYQNNSIFIPAAGYCGGGSVNNVGNFGGVWSSSLYASRLDGAWGLYFNSGDCDMGSNSRYYG